MIRFAILNGERAGETVECALERCRIGRSPEAELSLPAWHVSADHATIASTPIGYVLRDSQSTNGTRVRRGDTTTDLADAPDHEMVIEAGDELLLGDREEPVRVRVELPGEAEEAQIVSLRRPEDLERVEATAFADQQLLQNLYSAQKHIGTALELEQVIDAVAAEVFRFLTRATHITVVLRDDDDSERPSRYVPVATRAREKTASIEAIPITRSVFKKVVAERAAVLAADARKDVGETASLMGAQIHSTIGVPLWHGDDIVGVLQVDNRAGTGIFREHDLDVLAVLAQTSGQALAHARLYQRLRFAEERLRKENAYLKKREKTRRFDGIIGDSRSMKALFDQLQRVVDTRVSVLIEGETGTGKELVASAVHYWSIRRDKLFVAQNCAAMPENLLESELFGHRKGAFTGATDDKKGLFELADGGTLFLDEVTEMPVSLQPKLLRALQEGEIRPVGSNQTRKVDVRIVAATNRNLEKEVAEGRFREDLYYRLKVFPIRIPPLRERRDDIPLLANYFLERYAHEFGKPNGGFAQQTMELLQSYAWPGNVRELQNEVQRLVIQVGPGEFVQPEHLSPRVRELESIVSRVQPARGTLKEVMEQVEKWVLSEALKEHGSNKSATAKALGITREGLHKKLKALGIG